MLTIYRRHTKQCPFSSVREWRCGCPIWVSGTLGAAAIRRSLNLVSRGTAQKIIDRWENQGFVDNDHSFPRSPSQSSVRNPSELTTVDQAIQEFLLDMEDCRLEESRMAKKTGMNWHAGAYTPPVASLKLRFPLLG